MNQIINLLNKKFGKLKVISRYLDKNKRQEAMWICKCSCGNIKVVSRGNLQNGSTRSCGCLRNPSLIGKKFGRLTVLSIDRKLKNGCKCYRCVCSCGKVKIVPAAYLIYGGTKSCGCLLKEQNYKHGYSRKNYKGKRKGKVRIYCEWMDMRARCYSPTSSAYKNYGARGIKVCKRWDKFENFLKDMGPLPTRKHSLDRFPDVNGDYKPSNCRWATRQQQAFNRRNSFRTSKYYGVRFDKTCGFFRVMIKRKYIGIFKDEKKAALAYNKYSKKYYGKYACINKVN